jgi:GntR family transcriptional regulator
MLNEKEIPLYYQLETLLRKRILSGEFPPNTLLPSEDALSKEYGVSRITVRRALLSLEQEKLIARKRGKGTFVLKSAKPVEPARLTGFMEDIIALGIRTNAKVLDISWAHPPENVREGLDLKEADQVLRIEKVRLIDKAQFSYVLNYLPPDVGNKISVSKLRLKPISMIFEDDLNMNLVEAFQTLEATIADSDTASILGIRVGDPLLKVERTVFDETGKPVEHVSALYRADKYLYTVKLKREKAEHSMTWVAV